MTLKEAIAGAVAAGTKVPPSAALAIFLEAIRLADQRQALLSAAKVIVDDEGNLAIESDRDGSNEELVAAAPAFAREVFGADAPVALGWQDSSGGGPFPSLRHLVDALEFQLLRSRGRGGPPPPTRADCRLAVARLVAEARKPPLDPRSPGDRATDPPSSAHDWPTDPPLADEYATDPRTAYPTDPRSEYAIEPRSEYAIEPRSEYAIEPRTEDATAARSEVAAVTAEVATATPSVRDLPVQPPKMDEARPSVSLSRSALLGAAVASVLIGAVLGSTLIGLRQKSHGSALEAAEIRSAEASIRPVPTLPVIPPAHGLPAGQPAPRPPPRVLTAAEQRAAAARSREKLELGEKALEDGRIFEALVAFHDALDESTPTPRAARRLGDAYRLQHEDGLALSAYEQYLQLAPRAPDAGEVRSLVEALRATATAEE